MFYLISTPFLKDVSSYRHDLFDLFLSILINYRCVFNVIYCLINFIFLKKSLDFIHIKKIFNMIELLYAFSHELFIIKV